MKKTGSKKSRDTVPLIDESDETGSLKKHSHIYEIKSALSVCELRSLLYKWLVVVTWNE